MNIIFDPRPGEILDVFYSLWVMGNYEYHKENKKSFGVSEDNKYDEKIYSIIKNKEINMKNIDRYFYKELEPYYIIDVADVWKYSTIDSYLEYMRNIDEFEMRKKIITTVCKIIKPKTEEVIIEKLISDDNSVLDYIEDIEINPGLKWEFSLLLKNREKYLNDFIEFIKKYLDIYKTLDKERKKIMTEFNLNFEKNIKESGLDFLNKAVNNMWNFDNYETIYITTSVESSLYIVREKESCHLIIGPYFKDILKNIEGKDELERKLTFIKNICESTRFQIVKLLLKRDYYGQEIAEALGINKGTISHHMSYLATVGAIQVKKEGKKVYYSANKDILRESIQLLNKELNVI